MSISNQQSLQKYAKPLLISSTEKDKDIPFSFKDWYNVYQNIIPGDEFKQYNSYLIDWYKQKSSKIIDSNLQVKLNYLALLRQLQLFFSKEETENWYNKVDISNEKELLLAIPYFAKKLKDIALYYLQLRETIKESRTKYNQVGTNSGIVEQLQKFILTNYTQKPSSSISIPASIWRNVPELSSVQGSITIQIEELYDTKSYFDQSPNSLVSAYYDINNPELQNFLTTKGLAITSTEWIYKLGVFPLSADYISLSGEDLTELSKQLAEKYLGQDKYITLTPTFSARQDFYDIALETGNNFLFWPSGVFRSKAKTNERYKPTFINDSGLSTGATPGSSIEIADTIFIKTSRGVEGAWFRNNYYDFKTETMEAVFEGNDKTVFRFPFPGYGLSAEDINWTGFDLKSNPRFFFLSDINRENVESAYWSSTIDLTSTTPIKINDTTLVANKAFPNRDYYKADKIKVWTSPPNYTDIIYSGETKESWLYRMNQTDISIQGSGTSVIFWPYEQINPNNDFPNYYPKDVTKICQPLPISAINFSRAIAGNSLSSADIIYKVTNYKDTLELAIECCWLSGKEIEYPDTRLIITQQGELQILAESGTYTHFVWSGINDTDINTVFKTLKHQPDCKFVNTQNTSYLDFNSCTCKQVLFTPFGHPGNEYFDYNGFADFIIEDNFSPEKLDLSNWKDATDSLYFQSSAFCWYKTNSKVGWGDGQWVSGNTNIDNNFYLQNGKSYIYYRASVREQDKENIKLPNYILRHPYNVSNQTWIRAFKNEENEWVNSNTPSSMILYPGDILLYKRANTTNFILTSTIFEKTYISENRGSIWSNFDYLTIDDSTQEASFQQVTITYPIQQTYNISDQTPTLLLNEVVSVILWEITHNDTNQKITFKNTPSVTFTPILSGTYSVKVTAMSSETLPPAISTSLLASTGTTFYTNTGLYIFTQIPEITAISSDTEILSLTSFNTPVPGYVLNTPLKGWDYNRGVFNPFAKAEASGAHPYWAKTYLEKDELTRYKGVDSWGTPQRIVDEYNIITQPEISEIVLETGNYIEYARNYPVGLTWLQPVDLTVIVNENKWCTLEVNTTSISNLNNQLLNYKNELIVTPTTSTSNLLFQSFVDNEPVEIYYNALNSFTWNITASPEIPETIFQTSSATLAIQAKQPWANFSNQYFPTVAMFPGFDELYNEAEIGGFFTPTNLGASVYINQDYTSNLNISSTALINYFEDSKTTVNGRGLTKQDQPSPYNIFDNNIWLKEPIVSGPIAGSNKKSVFKKYQKFIPYQSSYETNPQISIGLLNPTSRQTPWTGKEDSEWGDLQNKPTTFTGELDIDKWANTQILKQTGLQVDNWCTDIFGNQYGLYKNLTNVLVHNRRSVPGEIWVRKNSQFVSPASKALSGVFDTYTDTNIINELTGIGIQKIDLFFDTLLIETSGAIIFEKLNYDYNTDNIFSIADEARYISLGLPVATNFNKEFANINLTDKIIAKPGETWFFPEKKQVIQSICGLQSITTQSTFYWELKKSISTTTFILTGNIELPQDSQSYIVNIGGVQQPSINYTINPATSSITFTQPVPPDINVYVLLPYNPNFLNLYDSTPIQVLLTSVPFEQSEFPIPSIYVSSFNESQYIVSVGGILQQPGAVGENTYTITSNNTINFNEPVPANIPVSIIRLPFYTSCSLSNLPYTWRLETTQATNSIKLIDGPSFISNEKNAYLVNVGGVLQAPSKYSINPRTKTIKFVAQIPKDVYVSITLLNGPQVTVLTPELYQLDLNTIILKKVFPTNQEDINTIESLIDLDIVNIDPPSFSHNALKREYQLTLLGKNCENKSIVADFKIDDTTYTLKNITVYTPFSNNTIIDPPLITQNLITNVLFNNTLNFQCFTINGSAQYELISGPSWLNLTTTGLFTGTPPPLTATYYITFKVFNSAGPTYYSLQINVIP